MQAERAVLAAVRLPNSTFDPRDPFGELRELTAQAGAVVVGELEGAKTSQVPKRGRTWGVGRDPGFACCAGRPAHR
ncbi:MAG: hypothetical protein R3B49_10015 [Phycisphaerales bacterium]